MEINNKIKNFLTPQHSVVEVLLASILTVVTIFFVFKRQSFILEFFPGVILTLMLSLYTLTSSILVIFIKKSNFERLKILQIFGMFLILIISFCYVVTGLVFVSLNNLIDYIFIFYALLTILRVIIIAGILRTSSIQELGKYIDKMPLAKQAYVNYLFLFLIILVCYIYYKNIEVLSIALGRSFYVGLFGTR